MQISPQRYRTITVVALVALAIIIVTGAAVRLTNSGLGCDDWPNCSNERFVDVSSKHAAIEQINRLFTGVVGFAAVAAVLGAFLRRAGGDPRLAPAAKLMRTELDAEANGLAAGLLGAEAMLEGSETERLLYSPGMRIAGGSSEIQRNILGERVLGLPREPS